MKKKLILMIIGCTLLIGCNSNNKEVAQTSSQVASAIESTTAEVIPSAEVDTQAPTIQEIESIESTSESSTQPITEAPTQPATEAPTQPATEAPTQPATEPPTQPTTEAPTQLATEPPTQPGTEAPTQPVTVAPTQPVTQTTPSSLAGYTFTELNQIMEARYEPLSRYAPLRNKFCLRILDEPTCYAKNRLGVLADGDKILVTGRCNETDMYRVEYNGQTGYISDVYLLRTDIPHEDSYFIDYDGKKQPYIDIQMTNGDDLAFTNTVTLKHSGITIPVLNKFNTAVLDSDNDSWFGPSDNPTALANYEFFKKNAEEIEVEFDNLGWITDSAPNVIDYLCRDGLSWGYSTPSSLSHSIGINQARYGEEYCTLLIRTHLDYEAAREADYTMWDYQELLYQDVLTIVLSSISSTPAELQEAILDTMYYAEEGQYPFLEEWTRIGDCQIRADIPFCSSKQTAFLFRIKP